jgi:hypothetical protein
VIGRVLRRFVLPALLGAALGLMALKLAPPWGLIALLVAATVWAVRELRWTRRMRREIEADLRRWRRTTRNGR